MPDEILRKPSGANVRLGTFVLLVILVAVAFGGAGYLYGINAGKTLTSATATPTPTISATISKTAVSSATSTADVTANWKTYTNDKYGFSFKYPLTWAVSDSNGEVLVTDTSKNYVLEESSMAPIIVQYAKDTYGGSIDNFVSQGSGTYKSILQNATTLVGDKTAYVIKGTTEPVNHDLRVVFYSGDVLIISSNAGNLAGQDPNGTISSTFTQILSTFQFTK